MSERLPVGFSLPRLPPPGGSRMINPIYAVSALTWRQQAIFWSGWLAWFADSYDFFCVSLTVIRLDAEFHEVDHTFTTAITVTLLLRSVGAMIFGLLSDRFGRKWPLIVVLLIICVLQIGSGFVTVFSQFLAVRSLFGIAMGGVWGLASAASMENMPVASRGLYAGFMQVGYPSGYLIASVVNLFLVPETTQTWRTIYWVGAGISALAAFVRFLLPESAVFERARVVTRQAGMGASEQTRVFIKSFGSMLKNEWPLWIYSVVLTSGLNFIAHGSQDLYTTFMQRSKGFSASLATEANIIGMCGAVFGGILGGYISQFLGRRLTLVFGCVWACAFIPLWILPNTWGSLSIGALFFQVGVNLSWGTVAVYLNEISPPAFRGVYPGTVHQLGNAVSSAAAQIEATAGLHIRKTVQGIDQPDYGTVQAIVAASSAGLVLLAVLFGPERHSAHFEQENTAVEEGAPLEAKREVTVIQEQAITREEHEAKGDVQHIERV